ncbi:hypothetical protein WICPIJ_001090 [Wickerhamomyces pijperi]|uniref:Uncharacterized protein n=1 Tax=Wickerhamomyces pijperi TaxID=599730 RepID=A0A9P8TR51_WICPI|nr:hypothetical protein WICPIJ_001090 [Wickerhamomyces pijperi]
MEINSVVLLEISMAEEALEWTQLGLQVLDPPVNLNNSGLPPAEIPCCTKTTVDCSLATGTATEFFFNKDFNFKEETPSLGNGNSKPGKVGFSASVLDGEVSDEYAWLDVDSVFVVVLTGVTVQSLQSNQTDFLDLSDGGHLQIDNVHFTRNNNEFIGWNGTDLVDGLTLQVGLIGQKSSNSTDSGTRNNDTLEAGGNFVDNFSDHSTGDGGTNVPVEDAGELFWGQSSTQQVDDSFVGNVSSNDGVGLAA